MPSGNFIKMECTMKNTIHGFSQDKLLQHGLDNDDALILRFVLDFFSTNKMSCIVDGNLVFFWLSYQYVSQELPILGKKKNSSPRSISRRFLNYHRHGLLHRKLIYELNGKIGTYTFFAFSDQFAELLFKPNKDKSPPDR